MKLRSLIARDRSKGTTDKLLRELVSDGGSVVDRRTVTAGLGMMVSAALLGPAAAASNESEAALIEGAKKEGHLSIIHGIPQGVMQAFGKEFNRKYPFISVEIERQQGLAVYQKFNAETRGGANLRDVIVIADVGAMTKMVADKMMMNYVAPNDADYPAKFKIPGYAYVIYLTEIVVAVNSALVSEKEGAILRDWKGILDPRWKGHIGTTYPSGGSSYGPLYMFLHGFPDKFGVPFLRAVAAQKPQIFASTATALERLISGEIQVLFTHWESHLLPRWKKGAPVRWYAPKPTPSYGNTYQGIAAKAPNPNAAKLWMNWILSDEGATAVNKIYASKSTLSTHKDQRDLPKASWYMPITDTYTPDRAGWIKNHDGDVKKWSEVFNYTPGMRR